MLDVFKLTQVMETLKIEILGLWETRWPGQGQKTEDFYYIRIGEGDEGILNK